MKEGSPPQAPLKTWPTRSGLRDLAHAGTPQEIHAVTLALEFSRTHGPWLFEGLPQEAARTWDGSWYPTKYAPSWWRVLSSSGQLVRIVRFHQLEAGSEDVEPGMLWLRTLANQHPLIFCPEGLSGPGVVIQPEGQEQWASREDVQQRKAALTLEGWPGPFNTVELQYPETYSEVFEGYFMPGRMLLDWFMGFSLSRGVKVAGFPKIGPPSLWKMKASKSAPKT